MTLKQKLTWKSTQVDVDRIIELYKAGVSKSEIGRRMDLDHTSIIYWVKRYIKEGKVEVRTVKGGGRPPKYKIKTLKPRGGNRYVKKDVCQWCGKPKEEFDSEMRLTHFCSLKCWSSKNEGIKNYLL